MLSRPDIGLFHPGIFRGWRDSGLPFFSWSFSRGRLDRMWLGRVFVVNLDDVVLLERVGVLCKGGRGAGVGVGGAVDGFLLGSVFSGNDDVGDTDGEVEFGVVREGRDGVEGLAGVVEGRVELDGGVGIGGGVYRG